MSYGRTIDKFALQSNGTVTLQLVPASAGEVSATGWISGPLDAVADLLASCAAFQTWLGVVGAVAAKARIYPIDVTEAEVIRPCAIVSYGKRRLNSISAGTPTCEYDRSVILMFQSLAMYSGTRAAMVDFTNNIGAITAEFMENSVDANMPPILSMEALDGFPCRAMPESELDLVIDAFEMELAD